jgi:hypothetical protein
LLSQLLAAHVSQSVTLWLSVSKWGKGTIIKALIEKAKVSVTVRYGVKH